MKTKTRNKRRKNSSIVMEQIGLTKSNIRVLARRMVELSTPDTGWEEDENYDEKEEKIEEVRQLLSKAVLYLSRREARRVNRDVLKDREENIKDGLVLKAFNGRLRTGFLRRSRN